MSNQFESAFDELLDCQEEILGFRPQATVGGVKADALVELITYDEVIVAGGVGESGGYKLMMRASDFVLRPARNSPANYKGNALWVLSLEDRNGIYEIYIGHPAVS